MGIMNSVNRYRSHLVSGCQWRFVIAAQGQWSKMKVHYIGVEIEVKAIWCAGQGEERPILGWDQKKITTFPPPPRFLHRSALSTSSLLSFSPGNQGEAICSRDPSLILAQRSWKMYSRQQADRGEMQIGPSARVWLCINGTLFAPAHPVSVSLFCLYSTSVHLYSIFEYVYAKADKKNKTPWIFQDSAEY